MRRRRPAHELRIAVDCLPLGTRLAMLDGMAANRIIVGAYVDRQGGVCPMLAAHRHGGRTSLASFARAWDRYTRAGRGPRPASEREVRTLRTMLEASIALDTGHGTGALADAIADHEATKVRNAAAEGAAPAPEPVPERPEPDRRPRAQRDTGEQNRGPELHKRHGWAWLRPFRRLDDYEQALNELEELERDRLRRREHELV